MSNPIHRADRLVLGIGLMLTGIAGFAGIDATIK